MNVYWRYVRRGQNLILANEESQEERIGGFRETGAASTPMRPLSDTNRAARRKASQVSKTPRRSWNPSGLGSYTAPMKLW